MNRVMTGMNRNEPCDDRDEPQGTVRNRNELCVDRDKPGVHCMLTGCPPG